jgi:alpha-glucosidase (family GH31 glycosyl hydrolase)
MFNLDQTSTFQFNGQDIIIGNSFGRQVGIYGLGERVSKFRLNAGSYTMFAVDQGDPYDSGNTPAN